MRLGVLKKNLCDVKVCSHCSLACSHVSLAALNPHFLLLLIEPVLTISGYVQIIRLAANLEPFCCPKDLMRCFDASIL